MSKLIVAGADPSLSAMGLAKMRLDLDTMELELLDLRLVDTERQVTKQVRQNSDDLRRCRDLNIAFKDWLVDAKLLFAEIPTGAQSARAALSFGMTTMLVATSTVPVIEVQPRETKKHTIGTTTASKEEMRSWAYETYPNGPWLRAKRKDGKGAFTNANEHLADACAVVHAGVKTQAFLQLMAMRFEAGRLAA